MAKLERSIIINAPIDEIYNYWARPEHVLTWPNMVHISHVQQLPNGGHSYRWAYNLGGIRLDGTVEDVEVVVNERYTRKIDGVIGLMLIAGFQPEEGATRVTIQAIFRMSIPIVGRVAEALIIQRMEREIDSMLTNLKARMEK
jgi:uncharacterized membrane protein